MKQRGFHSLSTHQNQKDLYQLGWLGGEAPPPVQQKTRPAPYLKLMEPASSLPPILGQRDPTFIRKSFRYLSWLTDTYYRAEVEGIEHLPSGPFLAVSTHNGGLATPDLYCLLIAFWRRFGLETPAYGLTHAMVFKLPLIGSFFAKLGALPASHENAATVLEMGFPLLICPGGDIDSLKPFRQRHRINFGGRDGFIRVALRHQVPIVPIVSVGAHEVFYVLNDGRRLAELTGAARLLRIKTIPLSLSFPLGLTPAGVFSIPLPSKIRIQILPPLELAEPQSAATDRARVTKCYEHVVQIMQRALDELASTRKHALIG